MRSAPVQMVQMTQVQGTRQEGARMHGCWSCAVAMGDLGAGPVIEYQALDTRFKGTRVCGEGKAGFQQLMASSRE